MDQYKTCIFYLSVGTPQSRLRRDSFLRCRFGRCWTVSTGDQHPFQG
ncbi:hypothetical protein [Neglectibacter caecimuris]|nr:hypothetical protein [Neglectibacter sp. M00184]